MLTGRRAFEGDDVPEILSRVLQREPDWTRLPSDLPVSIPKLLRLCLQKDVKQRRQAAGDVRIDLEQALTEPVTATPAAISVRGERLAWTVALAAAAMLIVALAIPAVRYLRQTPPSSPPEMRVEIVTPATTDPVSFALSPDGRQLVFVASGEGPSRLWLRSLTTTAAQPLVGTEGAAYPFRAQQALRFRRTPRPAGSHLFVLRVRLQTDLELQSTRIQGLLARSCAEHLEMNRKDLSPADLAPQPDCHNRRAQAR